MKPILGFGFLFALTVWLPAVADEIGEPGQGKTLFEDHGCPTCHGADGFHPISPYVPVLMGEPANALYENASAIFAGLPETGKTHFMYDRFCIGEAKVEGCYSVPSVETLRVIAVWLGGQGDLPEKKPRQGIDVTSLLAYEHDGVDGDAAKEGPPTARRVVNGWKNEGLPLSLK